MLGPLDNPQPEQAVEVKEASNKAADQRSTDQKDLDMLHVARAFGVTDLGEAKKYQDQIKNMVEYAYSKGAKSREDVVWELRQIGAIIGSPKLGNNWFQHLNRWIYLNNEKSKLEKEIKEYGGR